MISPPPLSPADRQIADRVLSGIDDIDWSGLQHAYGAATTTPSYIRALLSTDVAAREAGVDHLWSAVTHQGTVYSATVAATPLLVRVLEADDGRPVRPTILAALGAIASGASYADVHRRDYRDEERPAPEWQEQLQRESEDVAACHRAAADALQSVSACLVDPVDDVRLQATWTAATIAMLDEVDANERRRVSDALVNAAATDASDVVRASAVLSLALMGTDVRRWLQDTRPAVRLTAALAPPLSDDEEAHEILLEALAKPEALDALFPGGLPQLDGYPRFTVIAAVCHRVSDRNRALGPLLEALRLASTWTVDVDRGPMLEYFFPRNSAGTALTVPQRTFLEALVARDDLWDPKNGNAIGAFRRARLPYSRDRIWDVLASGVVPPR